MNSTRLFLGSLFFSAIVFVTHAQPLLSRDGEPVLPQPHNWGMGIDLSRMVSLAGFNLSQQSQLITGKYMIDSTHALRVGVRLGFNNTTTRNRTIDRVAASGSIQAFPAPMQMKDNEWQRTSWMAGISLGKETRRGRRLQGLYGYEFILMFSQVNDQFRYGNALNASPLQRITVDEQGDAMSSPEFGPANNIDTIPAIQGVSGSARVTKRSSGLTITAAARLFVGAEYFFLPKMSLGAELGWAAGVRNAGRSKRTLEAEGASNVPGSAGSAIRSTTIDGDTGFGFSAGHDQLNPVTGLSASIRVLLYF